MLAEPHAAASGRTGSARIDQLDPGALERGNQLHERIDVGPDKAVTGFHALDRRNRKLSQPGHLPLIDVQERASGPELMGGNHEWRFPDSGQNIFTPYKLLLHASIHKYGISTSLPYSFDTTSFSDIEATAADIMMAATAVKPAM
jgi:hypothetical protein